MWRRVSRGEGWRFCEGVDKVKIGAGVVGREEGRIELWDQKGRWGRSRELMGMVRVLRLDRGGMSSPAFPHRLTIALVVEFTRLRILSHDSLVPFVTAPLPVLHRRRVALVQWTMPVQVPAGRWELKG